MIHTAETVEIAPHTDIDPSISDSNQQPSKYKSKDLSTELPDPPYPLKMIEEMLKVKT